MLLLDIHISSIIARIFIIFNATMLCLQSLDLCQYVKCLFEILIMYKGANEFLAFFLYPFTGLFNAEGSINTSS